MYTQKKILFAIFSLLLIVISCSTNNEVEEKFPYQFVDTKSETEGNNQNKMDLFAYSGDLNIDTLKAFCKSQRNKFETGTFYYVVIFDSKENAVFPNNPLTAEYGIDEEPQKHIRAFYTYNKLNEYSKLDYYEKNKWESTANTVVVE